MMIIMITMLTMTTKFMTNNIMMIMIDKENQNAKLECPSQLHHHKQKIIGKSINTSM